MPDTIDFTVKAGEWEDGDLTETLTVEEAAKIIRKRLGLYDQVTGEMEGWSDKSAAKKNQTGGYDLSIALAGALPAAALNENVLQNMDMRTILQPILNTEVGAENRGDLVINGQTFTPAMQVKAGSAYIKYRDQAAEAYETKLLDAGFSIEDAKAAREEEMNRWRENPGTLIRTKDPSGQVLQDPNTGVLQTTGANQDLNSIAAQFAQVMADTGTGEGAPAFMTADDFKMLAEDSDPASLIRNYRNDISARAEYTRTTGQPAPDDPTRIRFEAGEEQGPYMRPGAEPEGRAEARRRGGSYTLSEARRLPNSMTRAEIAALSDKMKKAGLYAQVGGEPMVKGDAQDPAFTEAYRLLLSKTLQRGEPINDILKTDMLAYEEELDKNIRAKLTDPARIRASADSIGRQLLGRKLTNADHAKLVKFINDLEHKQAIEEGDEEGGDVTDVDWEARMGEYISAANPGEVGAHDTALQYDQFRQLLAGPGGRREEG